MSKNSSGPDKGKYRPATANDSVPRSVDEPLLSTRGQVLTGILQSRSASNLTVVRTRSYGRRSRGSFGEEVARHESSESGEDLPELRVSVFGSGETTAEKRRGSNMPPSMVAPQMRSERLIGYPNPRYRWEQYWKTDEQLKIMKKPLRKYYERTNYLIQHYMYIDRLLDSSLPHNLIQEYEHREPINGNKTSSPQSGVPDTITEEPTPRDSPRGSTTPTPATPELNGAPGSSMLKRPPKPKDIYRIKDENTPLLGDPALKTPTDEENINMPPLLEPEEEADSQSRIVSIAIYVNLVANTLLLIMKIVVVILSSSVSVLASLVDAALDFLSTAIVWTTTRLISHFDQYAYPIGRRRLEPIGVLVFSVVMITSFVQVALEGFYKLSGDDHRVVRLTAIAIAIMAATVVIKGLCWIWCRLIKNSSVQALAQDAKTDVVFNIFSIIFPLVGFYANLWWLDPLGGILLSFWVIFNWAQTSSTHIRNLTGAAASADERNILLYLTMRFAKSIKKIQALQAYHSGDKLNVEVDIVLDENTNLRDSHDLGESLQYVLESVPNVDRAFVHMDYLEYNLPSHLHQDS